MHTLEKCRARVGMCTRRPRLPPLSHPPRPRFFWYPARSLYSPHIPLLCAHAHSTSRAFPSLTTTRIPAAFLAFAKADIDLTLPKLCYLALNCLGVAMGMYKLNTIGLLPVTSADWSAMLPVKTPVEYSTGSFV